MDGEFVYAPSFKTSKGKQNGVMGLTSLHYWVEFFFLFIFLFITESIPNCLTRYEFNVRTPGGGDWLVQEGFLEANWRFPR